MTRVGTAVRGGCGLGFRFWPELLTEEPDFELLAVFVDFAEDKDWPEAEAIRWLVENERWPAWEDNVSLRLMGCEWDWWPPDAGGFLASIRRAKLPGLKTWSSHHTLYGALLWFVHDHYPIKIKDFSE